MVTAIEFDVKSCPKPRKPERSASYRAFVRSLPCCRCDSRRRRSICAHIGSRGTGQRPGDLNAIPLCPRCHAVDHRRPGDEWDHDLMMAQRVPTIHAWVEATRPDEADLLDIMDADLLIAEVLTRFPSEFEVRRRKPPLKMGQRRVRR